MKYVSIDIETTGLDPNRDLILEFAAIVDDTDNPLPLADCPKLHVILQLSRITGNPFAIQMNADLIRVIAGVNPPPDTAVLMQPHLFDAALTVWLESQFGVGNKAVAAGKNYSFFAGPFIKKMLANYSDLFHHRGIDPGSMFVEKGDKRVPSLTECLERAGLGEPTKLHSGLADAWDVIRLVRSYFSKDNN